MKNQGIIKNIHHHTTAINRIFKEILGRSDGGLKEHIQCRSKGDRNTLLNVGVREDELKCLIVVTRDERRKDEIYLTVFGMFAQLSRIF